MTHYYETKIGKIIEQESDTRMDGAIISYIVDNGWKNVKKITDKQIEKLEGNGLMTKEFVQSLVKAARRITKECDQFKDFFPYIRLYMGINDCQTTDLVLYKEDIGKDKWQEIIDDYDLCEDDSDVSCIELVTIIDGVEHYID